MRDVTAHWQRYHPAAVFCVKPQTEGYTPGGIGPTVTGSGQRGPGRSAPDPIGGLVNHQMGTMRMGDDPDTSVVDANQRFHGIPTST